MLTNREIIIIKGIVGEFFEKMTVPVEVKISKLQDQTLPVEIETEDPKILIGEGGQTLAEAQRLLKVILRRKIDKPFYIDLDVNNYKKKKTEYLKQLAKATADDVALNKKEKVLPSMTAYERRIIHMELADRNNITTKSVGEEPQRRVAIRPYP